MRKNIALFVSYFDNEFSKDIIDGVCLAAEEQGVNLFILPTRLLNNDYYVLPETIYEYQFNTMLSYADKSNIDGIVIETGIIGNGLPDDVVKEHFDKFGDIPVVGIARKIEGYPNVCFNCHGLHDEIQHLIDVHGCKRIGFIGGPESNPEAMERFELYKKTLAENGIAYDKKLYAEGNFSEFSEDVVKRVLELNRGNIDALCFANDRMAIGGYNALAEMGLTPGKDICVTGFDDAPSASAMNPMLTTVHSNITTLGYHALCQCVDIINGKPGNDVNIDTSIIIRSSCGCPSRINVITEKIASVGSIENININSLFSELQILLCGSLGNDSAVSKAIEELMGLFRKLLEEISLSEFNSEKWLVRLYEAIERLDFETISFSQLSFTMGLIRKRAVLTAFDRDVAEEFFFDLSDKISNRKFMQAYEVSDGFRKLSNLSSSIIYDVIANIKDEAASYFSIIRNVHKHHSVNSYLFIHEFPVACHEYKDWYRPRTERLICFQNGENEVLLPAEEQKIPSEQIFRCAVSDGKRHTYVASPLFHDDENYGLIFCEHERKDYAYFSLVVTKQISYALKMKRLMEEQLSVQERLSSNMELIESYNTILRKKSISDELTGVLNRRGFMETVGEMLANSKNYGKRAVIAFADMNFLKTINDKFGHDDGDFAIKGMATILTHCVRDSDIVSRFGGDEFATFCFTKSERLESIYRKRIKRETDSFNEKSGKPYLVTLSIGIYEFICDENTSLTQCMNTADAFLYEDKKNKPSSIIR